MAATLSPSEVDRHVDVAQSLDENVTNRSFWVSFQVVSAPEEIDPAAAAALVLEVDDWLWELEDHDPLGLVERRFAIECFVFGVRAAPKRPRARARGGTIIANPYPTFAHWPGS